MLWVAAGAGAGIYALVRGRRAAETLTADGLRDRWQALGVGAQILRDEVAWARAEKVSELRERFPTTYDSTPQLTRRPGVTDNHEEGSST
jgi:hypothetical protein